jgi:predicted nucleotidyltransferase
MRLSPQARRTIRDTVTDLLGPGASVRLFGSRVDETTRGGDIDLLVEVDHVLENRPAAARRLAARLQMALGDQRIDVVLIDPATLPQPIHDAARSQGVYL